MREGLQDNVKYQDLSPTEILGGNYGCEDALICAGFR